MKSPRRSWIQKLTRCRRAFRGLVATNRYEKRGLKTSEAQAQEREGAYHALQKQVEDVDKQFSELQSVKSNVNGNFHSSKSKFETNRTVIKKLERALATIKGLEGDIVGLQQRKVLLLNAPAMSGPAISAMAGNTIAATRELEGIMRMQEGGQGLGGEGSLDEAAEAAEAAARDREARAAVMGVIGEYLEQRN